MPKFGALKTFGIFCPSNLRSLYPVPSTWFDTDGYLLLGVHPENFTPEDVYLGEQGLVATFNRLAYQGPRKVIRGCQITIPDGRSGLFYLVEHLASQATGNPYAPVLIKDYIRPERGDYAAGFAAQSEPFTQRQGVISNVTLKQGTIGLFPKLWAAEGFSFKFHDQTTRDV